LKEKNCHLQARLSWTTYQTVSILKDSSKTFAPWSKDHASE
jgi:hypothetical protein